MQPQRVGSLEQEGGWEDVESDELNRSCTYDSEASAEKIKALSNRRKARNASGARSPG